MTIRRDLINVRNLFNKINLLMCFCFYLFFIFNTNLYAEKQKISSQKIPITYNNHILFYIYSGYGNISIQERGDLINKRLNNISKQKNLSKDSLVIIKSHDEFLIKYNQTPLMIIGELDSLSLKKSKESIAKDYKNALENQLFPILTNQRVKDLAIDISLKGFQILLVLGIGLILYKFLNKFWIKISNTLKKLHKNYPNGFNVKGINVISAEQLEKVIGLIIKLTRFITNILIIYNIVYMTLYIIPTTQTIAKQLQSYIIKPFIYLGTSFLNYLPNVFFIFIIIFLSRYCLKFLRYLFDEIKKGNIKLKNFHSDWADSTFYIVKFLIYFFVVVVIFPYLPGSNSPAFKGVSIFVGVLFSLGSSSAISNIIAGIVITYMRVFKVGDIVKVGETTGELIECSLLVIRIRTFKNVEISIPNSLVLNGQIYDYSHYSDEGKMVIHTKITIGYEVPWRTVHNLLIDAAKQTKDILPNKEPFVLQNALNDYNVEYEINAYTKNAKSLPQIYSDLHKNIQDCFNKANIEILSPMYNAFRNGNSSTIPKKD